MKKIIVTILFVYSFISVCYANNILHINKKESIISTGTTLTEYEILASDGWIEAQVLEIDLNDENNKIGLLTAKEGAQKLDSISNMVNANNAIAGINGDFFAGSKGIGSSIGIAIKDGIIYSSSAEQNKTSETFASILLDKNNNVICDYIRDNIKIISNNFEMPARYINKYTDNTDIATIYTSEWGDYSIGSSDTLKVTEIVVENGKVTEIRDEQGPVEIPKNGFVIMATGDAANQLKNNLRIKSQVEYSISYIPDVSNIEFAISGGTKLIENGIIPESYTHNVTGKNPRTIIGTNKKKDKIYLITIDGRSNSSTGMTLNEASEFLKTINVYTAINLDGGGSTTMVAKKLGEEDITEINNPSGGTQRLVANGVGVFATSTSTGKLYGLKIIVEDKNFFVGEKRKVKVVGYDKKYNPVEIDEDNIKWDYDGVDVTVKDGYITGEVVGSTELIAKIGKIKTTQEINVLSKANEIVITPKEAIINPGENVTYSLLAKNKNGYYAKTDEEYYVAKIFEYYKDKEKKDIPSDAVINDLKFSATTPGIYIISISKDECTSYAKVQVSEDKFHLIDDFEKESFTFDPYPDEVGGNAVISSEQKYSGSYSARLDYDFDKDAKVRGAYIVLNEEAIIPESANSISFYLYNDEYKDEKLKIKLRDKNNAVKLIVIQDNISHEGWKEIRYDVTSLERPLRISDIYLAQDDSNIRKKGHVFVDKFGYYANGEKIADDGIIIPKDIKLEDSNNISVNNENSFDIAFISGFEEPNTMMDVLKTKRLIENINKNTNMTVITKNVSESFKNKFISSENDKINKMYGLFEIEKINNKVFINEKYDLYSNDNCTIITLDVSNEGIRKSDETQYRNLEADIKDDETGNIIIVLNGSLDDFSDSKERKVLVDMLNEFKFEYSKNILVIEEGYNQDYSMERGVKILSVKDPNTSAENAKDSRYLVVSVNKKEMSYEYKKTL